MVEIHCELKELLGSRLDLMSEKLKHYITEFCKKASNSAEVWQDTVGATLDILAALVQFPKSNSETTW